MLKPALRILLSALMIGTGSMHFLATETYMTVMPSYLPWHWELVLISGAASILGGVGLFIPTVRSAAGIGLIVLYAAVLPANVHMAIHNIQPTDFEIPPLLLWLRLPLQLVLMAWAWWVSRPNTKLR